MLRHALPYGAAASLADVATLFMLPLMLLILCYMPCHYGDICCHYVICQRCLICLLLCYAMLMLLRHMLLPCCHAAYADAAASGMPRDASAFDFSCLAFAERLILIAPLR